MHYLKKDSPKKFHSLKISCSNAWKRNMNGPNSLIFFLSSMPVQTLCEKRIWIMKLLFRKSCSVSNLDFKTSFSKEKIVSIIIPMAELWRHNCKLIFYIISNRLTYYAFSFTELKKLKLVVGISATMCHSAEKIPAKEGCHSS